MQPNANEQIETRSPWRLQLNFGAAVHRDDENQAEFSEVYEQMIELGQRLGMHFEFGFIMPMERGDVHPGSRLDEDLRLSARPSLSPPS